MKKQTNVIAPQRFVIDPLTDEFKKLRSVCEPGSPYRCLIATTGSMELGRRMTVRLDHEKHSGVIGVTVGALRYERPMTAEEVEFATKFDTGARMRKPVTVVVDLGDGTWESKPKRKGGPHSKIRNGNAKPHTKTIRARQLEAIKKARAAD